MSKKPAPLFTEEQPSTAVSVTEASEKTPITGKEIPTVDADMWEEMTPTELYEQLYILEQRMTACYQYGSVDAAKQIQRGITRLQGIIKQKDDEVKLL